MKIEPLASILRPKSIDDIVGQEHLVGDGGLVRTFMQKGKIPSMIFRGPPGCGKTTLAKVISLQMNCDFHHFSGVSSKKADLTNIIQVAKKNFESGYQTILFLDEIHRRNKAQQDALLPHVEDGVITLIGATTENPSFTINNALISRSRVFVFNAIQSEIITDFFKKKLSIIKNHYPNFQVSEQLLELVGELSNGDLRNSINIFEQIIANNEGEITKDQILTAFKKALYYDRNGEEHYNIISAIHKSLRDGDPDASCYRIQRMLQSGEDPLYVARRLLRFASEDIGLANSNALLLANQVYDAVSKIGMPESGVFLMQLGIYLAQSPKDNTAYKVDLQTKEDIMKYGNLPVPMVIRNAPSKLMKELGYGKDYKYAHNFKGEKMEQQHMPDKLIGRKYL